MFAIVESGSITSYTKGNRGVQIGSVKHSADIFTSKWTESERNTIGVYTIEIDESNKKNEKWYINTDITYAFSGGKVTGSYGSATAREHADKDGVPGLKTILINDLKGEVKSLLAQTDWYVVRKADTAEAVPSSVATHRAAVRTKQVSMETAITNAADTAALETLYTYTEQGDGSLTRPLGELPTLE